MKTLILALTTAVVTLSASAQEADTIPKRGSYLYYGQPSIEDNSMFIEEAFNQEAGIIQHISNFVFNDGNFAYNYTQEIPIKNERHQLSFGVSYASLKKPTNITDITHSYITNGLGDIFINYRPLLFGKNDWALVIPRFSLIVPTGNSRYGLGSGSWGGQFNLAVTKRLGSKITTHYNAGYTLMTKADHYAINSDGSPVLLYEKNVSTANVGMSAIWLVAKKFNLMVEYISAFGKEMEDDGLLTPLNTSIVNPGFRMAIDIGNVQIVPGVGVPFNFANGKYESTGGFIYLSIEPAY
ncbi:MAG: transporter [Chryseolinea sp.]